MNSFAYVTFCVILILSSVSMAQGQSSASLKEVKEAAASKSEKKFSAEWRLRMSGEDYHDEQSQSKIFALKTDLKAKYQLHSSLLIDLQPSLRLQSGTTQSVDGADKPENKISLTQAALVYRPFNMTRVSAGALNQTYLHSDLLVDEIAFPAARAELLLTRGTLLSALVLESAIPTSTSLSTNTRELEPTPSLNTVALKMNLQGSKNLYLRMTGGYFIFNNLPSAVAQSSRLLGNEVDVISDAQYAFTHKFEGYEAKAEFKAPALHWLNIYGKAEYIVNIKAPSGLNSGSIYGLGAEIFFDKALSLDFEGGVFSIAPEAAVSYFNAGRLETNRNGYFANTFLDFEKQGFRVGIQYQQSDVMYINSIQSKDQKVFLKLETSYVDI